MTGIGHRAAGTGQDDDRARMRKLARRSLALGRRWMLRSALLLVIAFVAFRRDGSLMFSIGVAAVLLAVLSFSLGQSMRRSARASLDKLDLMEKTGAPQAG